VLLEEHQLGHDVAEMMRVMRVEFTAGLKINTGDVARVLFDAFSAPRHARLPAPVEPDAFLEDVFLRIEDGKVAAEEKRVLEVGEEGAVLARR